MPNQDSEAIRKRMLTDRQAQIEEIKKDLAEINQWMAQDNYRTSPRAVRAAVHEKIFQLNEEVAEHQMMVDMLNATDKHNT